MCFGISYKFIVESDRERLRDRSVYWDQWVGDHFCSSSLDSHNPLATTISSNSGREKILMKSSQIHGVWYTMDMSMLTIMYSFLMMELVILSQTGLALSRPRWVLKSQSSLLRKRLGQQMLIATSYPCPVHQLHMEVNRRHGCNTWGGIHLRQVNLGGRGIHRCLTQKEST